MANITTLNKVKEPKIQSIPLQKLEKMKLT